MAGLSSSEERSLAKYERKVHYKKEKETKRRQRSRENRPQEEPSMSDMK